MRFVGIMFQRVTVKHRPHFGTAQGKPEMARLRSLHRVHAQTTRLCGRARKDFDIQTHATFIIGVAELETSKFALVLFGKIDV